MTTLNKTFSIKNGLDVANTIVLDSNRNLRNIATANATTVNSTYFYTSAGLDVPGQANAAYAKANAPITIREVYAGNNTVVNTFNNINTIQFDADSGMAVVDEGTNTVTIQLNSTFKYWNINGSPGLEAAGLDTVNFIPGSGITITANNNASPKSITFSSTASGSGLRVAANNGTVLTPNTLVFNNSSSIAVNVEQSGANANVTFEFAGGEGYAIIESNRYTGTGSCTSFTLSQTSTTKKTFVYIDGVSQKPEVDYQVVNKTLTFNVAPPNAVSIEARSISEVKAGNVSSIISDKFTGTGACTQFTLSTSGIVTNTAFVFIDGVTQVPTTDYSISGNTITFTTAPENNAVIELRGFEGIRVFEYSNTLMETNTRFRVANSYTEFYANGFSTPSDSISRTYLLRGTTTNATESELFLVNGDRIPVSTNTTVFYTADIVGRRTDAIGESAGYHVKGVTDNYSGSVADIGNLYEVVVAEDDVDWSVDARADDTNNTINIYVTGENAKTIRWTALVRTVEVAN